MKQALGMTHNGTFYVLGTHTCHLLTYHGHIKDNLETSKADFPQDGPCDLKVDLASDL